MLKRFLPRTLLGRFVLIIVTPVVLLQAVTALIFYERHWKTIQRYQTGSLSGEIAIMASLIEDDPSPDNVQRVMQRSALHFGLRTAFARGAILPEVDTAAARGSIDEDLRNGLEERVRRPYHLVTDWERDLVRVQVGLAPGVLTVEAPLKRVFSSTTYIFLMWMVGTAIVLVVVALMFMRNQVRPIRRLAAAMDEFGKGRDVEPPRPHGAIEVRLAANAFLRMQARLRRQIQQRTEMLAGVSHDLRTVLTRMRLQIAMLGSVPGSKDLSKDVGDMESMLEGYLAFARGAGGEASVETRLGELLEEVAEDARRNGGEINLTVHHDGSLPLKRNAMKRCLDNLVGNGLAHARRVWIEAELSRDAAIIHVDDDGEGIPAHLREEVFKPFFRSDQARNLDAGGVGLGLTIARDVVHSHGGELVLEDAPQGGLRATIRLPL